MGAWPVLYDDDGQEIPYTACQGNFDAMSPESRAAFAELIRAAYRMVREHPERFTARRTGSEEAPEC